MAFPLSHKTVFVLDQSNSFAQPCEHIEIESAKSSQTGFIPLPSVDKSIWSSATESVLEYSRVVYDIFPPVNEDQNEQRLLRFVVFNEKGTSKVFQSWDRKHQSSNNLANELAHTGRPDLTSNKFGNVAKAKERLKNGIRVALEILTELTDAQRDVQSKGTSRLINRGRLVCLTFAEDIITFMEDLASVLQLELSDVNSSTAGSNTLATIAQLEIDVVCCYSELKGNNKPMDDSIRQLSRTLSYNVSRVPAGVELSKKLLSMALRHFDLASTTVTGIPMKEEQNASSSANYDVELFHKASAHWRLLTMDLGSFKDEAKIKNEEMANWLPQTQKEGCNYKTITLKWCTPRGSSADLHNCTALARISPTDVNSRPSACLTNFLLSGRSVMLEMPRRSGAKILSHMLTSHGGEIFIHTLNISRSILEDPPSISEGPGGRVTDYRIPDFGILMKSNRVAPFFGDPSSKEKQPIDKMRERVARFSKFCPMIISATTIFNMETLEPLQRILVQEELSEDNLAECRKIIYSLIAMEHRGDVLPVPLTASVTGSKGKSMKKDDQYKLMFGELERFVSAHCRTERHFKVLDCLLESRNRPASERPASRKDEKVELDVALRELDKYSAMTQREKEEFNAGNCNDRSYHRARSSSPAPPLAKRQKTSGSGSSLLDLWTKNHKENTKTKYTVPFAGMRSVGDKARLYLSLDRKDKEHGASIGEM